MRDRLWGLGRRLEPRLGPGEQLWGSPWGCPWGLGPGWGAGSSGYGAEDPSVGQRTHLRGERGRRTCLWGAGPVYGVWQQRCKLWGRAGCRGAREQFFGGTHRALRWGGGHWGRIGEVRVGCDSLGLAACSKACGPGLGDIKGQEAVWGGLGVSVAGWLPPWAWKPPQPAGRSCPRCQTRGAAFALEGGRDRCPQTALPGDGVWGLPPM